MPSVLLVHGAWHGAWCWGPLQTSLSALGVDSVALDLPGHGYRRRLSWMVRWRAYIDAVHDAVAQYDVPPIVVGHSMGGGVISGAAELAPELFGALVYIAAFVPLDGESISDLAKTEPPAPGLKPRLSRGEVYYEPDDASSLFFHDVPDAGSWGAMVQPQPIRPVRTPIRLTSGRYGSVPRYYVACNSDRALSPAFQQRMIDRTPMRRVFRMESGHSPFLSDPQRLAAILEEIIDGIGADGARPHWVPR
ncbi:alpha/beta fold hydrolase [Sphingomonas sp. GB1N7]|uniref:alpha/beta fold hydrolase n=1 Tax=Parasphingomonas caseinilytica TaxID=3096158 RepID=UPI002FC7B51E